MISGAVSDGDLMVADVPAVTVLGIDRVFIPQDKPDRILARFGLDGPGLAQSVRDVLAAPVLPRSDGAE